VYDALTIYSLILYEKHKRYLRSSVIHVYIFTIPKTTSEREANQLKRNKKAKVSSSHKLHNTVRIDSEMGYKLLMNGLNSN
ncbi:hypothetical protein BK410_15990, partial [Vibrio anguillarum]